MHISKSLQTSKLFHFLYLYVFFLFIYYDFFVFVIVLWHTHVYFIFPHCTQLLTFEYVSTHCDWPDTAPLIYTNSSFQYKSKKVIITILKVHSKTWSPGAWPEVSTVFHLKYIGQQMGLCNKVVDPQASRQDRKKGIQSHRELSPRARSTFEKFFFF